MDIYAEVDPGLFLYGSIATDHNRNAIVASILRAADAYTGEQQLKAQLVMLD